MSTVMLEVKELRKSFGGVKATDGVSLEVIEGEVHAIIGPNGAGKTTLISQLSGLQRSDGGSTVFAGRDITRLSAPARSRLGLARTFQITSVFHDFTALQNVALAIQAHSGHSFRFLKDASSDQVLTEPARRRLADVGLGERADIPAGDLAHGEQRQLEIAMALATDPKMLLLDEPMAGMGPADSADMTSYLKSIKGQVTMLLVEHDMQAVFQLADRISVLVYGRIIATGDPQSIRSNKEVREAYLGED